jgi:hypothetical protein
MEDNFKVFEEYLVAAGKARAMYKDTLCLAAVEALKEDILNYILVEERDGAKIKWYFKRKDDV